jgi:hypothetical protein
MRRREALKIGLVGAVLLALGGGLARVATLDGVRAREELLRAVIPVFLDTRLPEDASARATAIDRCLAATVATIESMPPHVAEELDRLFKLLALAPARWALAGIASSWQEADAAKVFSFLSDWRHHRIALFRSAYLALHDLVIAAWYADEASWPSLGYDGPPTV